MKATTLQKYWIIFLSCWYTLKTCVKAVYMRFTGQINRPWVDKIISIWINQLLDTARVKCTVSNPNNTEPPVGRATIIMCNHSSLYDIPISYKAFPNHSMRMLAKREIGRIPIMGKGMQAAEFPFVDRKNRRQAIKDLAYARQLMESGIMIWIAPEGTRSKDGSLGTFKKGAFITAIEAEAVIIPIGIRGAFSILPARTHEFYLDQQAEIHIGSVIDTRNYSLENKEVLIHDVHQMMEKLVNDN